MQELVELIVGLITVVIRFIIEMIIMILEFSYEPIKYILSENFRTEMAEKYENAFSMYLRVFGPLTISVIILMIPLYMLGFFTPEKKEKPEISVSKEQSDKDKNDIIIIKIDKENIDAIKSKASEFMEKIKNHTKESKEQE